MAPVELTVILVADPGKAKRFLELFSKAAEHVEANEPLVDRYEIHKCVEDVNGKEQYVIYESYQTQEAFDMHMKASPVQTMFQSLEQDGLQIIQTTRGSGITPR
ncbi:hypothetical protein NM208_g5568 [Fusarium decemcellulare]|uniref:Uncharacterized protein n=1 Tax=Fusarium decemcellulare TaxID=57161 RepID=A0ACC1SGQ6_9HYPO|nr:hypothetical protein NM208_g5568 [Fusarium decemcellulare]